jgi:hypothetical protein
MRLESSDAQIRFSVYKCMLINQEGFAKFIVTLKLQGCQSNSVSASLGYFDPINANLQQDNLQWRLQGGTGQDLLIQTSIDADDTRGNVATPPHARRQGARLAKMKSPIGIAGGLAAHGTTTNHPGDMTIEIPNTGAGGIGQQNVGTEMADRREKAPLARLVVGAKVLFHPRPRHFKQTRTRMQWLW